MTNLTLHNNYGQKYDPFIIGFDRVLQQLETLSNVESIKKPNYPPYNIRYQKDGDAYTIDIAVAGFSREELDIHYEDNKITVVGTKPEEDDTEEYLHKGISNRNFSRTFTLAETIFVVGATMNNGMLNIHLQNIVPENKKPKQIKIENLNIQD